MCSMSFQTGKRILYNIILFDGAYFLLAVMAGGVSNQLRMANEPAVLAGYPPLLRALVNKNGCM